MRNDITGKPDVPQREVAIIDFLRSRSDGASARVIYEEVTAALGDTISRPAYYKVLDRLVVAGKLDQIDDLGGRRYKLADQLYTTNRLTLDDVYELLPFVAGTESMARAVEAQQYFREHRDTVLRRTAEALMNEPAVELVHRWICDLITMLEADLGCYQEVELADNALERRLKAQCSVLRDILYRQLSIPFTVIDLPDWDGPDGLQNMHHFHYDVDKLYEVLRMRIFGVGEQQTVLGMVKVERTALDIAQQEMLISGSDGSFHAGTLGLQTAGGYVEDESFVVTFNNGVSYLRSSKLLEASRGAKKFFHSAPLTRETLDDPAYKGMVLAPFMFPMLTDSEYEHMTRAASDVVQMRVDDELISGTARDVATGEQIPAPRVHIRDGTIAPHARGFNHYYRMDPYGDIAREGIVRRRSILQRLRAARGTPQVYAGAVKSTRIKLFSRLVNWYISKGSQTMHGKAIEPAWDTSHANFIADIDVMTQLLAALEPSQDQDGFWMSCVVVRQFPALTEFYDTVLSPNETWFDPIRKMREDTLDLYRRYRKELPYHAVISEDDLADDSYVYLLDYADFASFYIGHTAGEPAPKLPRYEFLCSLREMDANQAARHIRRNVQLLATALLTCGFTPDRDHNFLSRLTLVKLVPSVVYRAHEFAKHLGKRLESDYKSAVVRRLAQRRNERINERDVEIRPIGLFRYLRRSSEVWGELPPPDPDEDVR